MMTQERNTPDSLRAALEDADALLSALRDLNAVEATLLTACRKTEATGKKYSRALSAGLPDDDSLGATQSAHYAAQAELAEICQQYVTAHEHFDTLRRNPKS
jgi:hypothetical protein